MRRIPVPEWHDWRSKVPEFGYDYHTNDEGVCVWRESHAYTLTSAEVDQLESATMELHQRCLEVAFRVVQDSAMMTRFGIPLFLQNHVRDGVLTNRQKNHLLGRMDLAYDATGQVKLLEYNANTPTLAIETAIIQWQWLQAIAPQNDQFNSLHEKLIARFEVLRQRLGKHFWFAPYPDSLEDLRHCEYYADLAQQAGCYAKMITLDRVGLTGERQFVDQHSGDPIHNLYALYPWELMVQDAFSMAVPTCRTNFIEPAWKMILSSKAMLPTLWEYFPHHPNLLRAQWSPEGMGPSYVIKPVFSREGQNVTVVKDGQLQASTEGAYARYPVIFQDYVAIPKHDGFTPVIGSWMVGDEPAGVIFRETPDLITRNESPAVPHYIVA